MCLFLGNSCQWMGENCSSHIIQPVDTSLGRCYTFNGRRDNIYNATETGILLVLHLALWVNVEANDAVCINVKKNLDAYFFRPVNTDHVTLLNVFTNIIV